MVADCRLLNMLSLACAEQMTAIYVQACQLEGMGAQTAESTTSSSFPEALDSAIGRGGPCLARSDLLLFSFSIKDFKLIQIFLAHQILH